MPFPEKLNMASRMGIIHDYMTTSLSMEQVGKKYGVCGDTVSNVLNSKRYMAMYREKKVDPRRQRAELKKELVQIKAMESAPDAIDQIIKIAQQEVNNTNMPYQYVIANACKELLDRAGVKAVMEDGENDIVIRFAGDEPIKLGMPGD